MIKVEDITAIMTVEGVREHMPCCAVPTPFPQTHYEHAIELQPAMNLLYAAISHDRDYLLSVTRTAASADPFFTGPLCDLIRRTRDPSGFTVFLIRSDYLIDSASNSLKQVEVNAYSPIFGPSSDRMSEVYRRQWPLVPVNSHIEITADTFLRVHVDWKKMHDVEDAIVLFLDWR